MDIRYIMTNEQDLELKMIWKLLALGLFDTALLYGNNSIHLKDMKIRYSEHKHKHGGHITIWFAFPNGEDNSYSYSTSQELYWINNV